MSQNFVDTLVIGAGASGLAFSALMAQSGHDFVCLEAHSLPGGCASFFKSKGMSFDVGATTLSGMAFNGPLKQFIDQVDLDIELTHIDPGVVISTQGQKIKRFCNRLDWIEEQSRVFKNVSVYDLWNQIEANNETCWKVTSSSRYYPPQNLNDLKKLGFTHIGDKLSVLPLCLRNFESYFLSTLLTTNEYKKFLNELLMISAQNTIDQAPAIVGVMGLSYNMDTWYPSGGMGEFSKSIVKKIKQFGGDIRFNHKVVSINQLSDDSGYIVETDKGETLRVRKIVSTLPLWNTQILLKHLNPSVLTRQAGLNPPVWGALTGYYKIKIETDFGSLYHQVHQDSYGRFKGQSSDSCFLSLSAAKDYLRGENEVRSGYRTLSISTHIDLSEYSKLLAQEGEAGLKAYWDESFQKVIKNYFGSICIELENTGIGDPKTFEKFTSRHQGCVGGLPHDMRKSIFRYPSSKTGLENVFQIGDTTFPGQGVVGVLMGAMNLFYRHFS